MTHGVGVQDKNHAASKHLVEFISRVSVGGTEPARVTGLALVGPKITLVT